MAKSLRDQMLSLGLVTEHKVKQAEATAKQRVNRECFANALKAARRVEADHKFVVVEYRRAREAGGKAR
jgi:predicted DNA-binding protein (UPF0251 family)